MENNCNNDQSLGKPADEVIIGGRFRRKELLHTTEFSKIYAGINIKNSHEVIIKAIPNETLKRANELRLAYEYLTQFGCMPAIHWLGYGQREILVVFEKSGPSLNQHFESQKKVFSVLTVFYIMEKMLQLLEKFHQASIVHGNLKPSKILVKDTAEEGINFLVCGFEKTEFLELFPATNKYGCKFRLWKEASNNKFASLHAHKKMRFRDDLESLGYICIYFLSKGKAFDESSGDLQSDRTKFLIDYKSQTSVEKLTLGLPRNQSNNHLTANEFTIEVEVTEYMKYVQTLRTYDTPDYTYLRNLFLKGCQKIYIKSQEATVCDWKVVPLREKDIYRSKMVNYFFSMKTASPKKTLKFTNKKSDSGMQLINQNSILNQESEHFTSWQEPIFEASEDCEKTYLCSLSQSRRESDCDVTRDGCLTPQLKTLDRAVIRDRLAFAAQENLLALAKQKNELESLDSHQTSFLGETQYISGFPLMSNETILKKNCLSLNDTENEEPYTLTKPTTDSVCAYDLELSDNFMPLSSNVQYLQTMSKKKMPR